MSAGASDVLLRLLRRAAARRRAPAAASGGMNVEEIEPRILHSADLAPIVVGDPAATQVEMRVLDAVPAPANDALSVQQKVRHELVIVDAATPDYRLLIEDIAARADATREIEVVLLEPGGDGLRQITEALSQRSGLDALHIISHGSDGALYLGRDVVDAAALARYAEQVASWSHALGADADILLYGCDVSASAQGRVFADTLARLTGADVAASDDLTGAAARGGDWALEYHAGSIETDIAFSAGALQSWQGILGNTAPTLSGANNLSPITEDPATNSGTLVSSLIAGYAADADAGALTGIAVTAADNTNGTWQYSTDGASTWTGFGTPGASSARLLAADATTYVRFVPNANWNGSVVNGLTFRAWDRTTGTAGGTADTTVGPSTLRDNFNVASYSNNDGSTSWSAAWVDTDASPTGGQIRVTSNRLQFDGGVSSTSSIYRDANLVGASSATLTFDFNNAVSPGTLTLQVSSNGGTSYSTLANSFSSGPGSASFDITAYASTNTRIRFTVVGDGGLILGLGAGGPFSVDNVQIAYVAPLNGGPTAFSSAVASSGITVSAVNDAPTGTSNTVTTNEDTAYVFTPASFGFTDANDTPANALSAVSISALPAAGALTLNGVAVTTGQSVSAANIAAGRLVYTPGANASGAAYTSFTFRVQDDGGIATGGVDLDPVARTMTINVTPVNDAPAGTSTAVTTVEDTAYVFTAASFGFTDANDTPANTLSAVRISTLPTAGALTLNGVAVAAGQFVGVAGISAGGLVFTPAANANGAGYSSFTFQVRDDGGTVNGGVDLDPVARTMTINVTAVNDAPVLTGGNNLTAINEDPAGNPGTLVSALIAGRVSDADAAAASGIAVVGADNARGDWQYSINGGSSWTSFGIPSPGSGRLLAADANTYVRFVPDANWNGTVTSGLTFRAWDRSTGANGGMAPTIPNPVWRDEFRSGVYSNNDGTATWNSAWVDSDADANGGSIRINSNQLEFRPNNSASIYREANLSGVSSATLSFSFDSDFRAGDSARVRLLVSANGGASYTALADFSASSNTSSGTFSADISAYLSGNTRILFDIVGTDGGSRRLRVDDLQIAAVAPGNGGATAFSTATASSSITVNSVNDAPRGSNNTVIAREDTTGSFTASMFGFTDPRDVPDDRLIAVKITSLATAGTLAVNGVALTAGQSVGIADINAGNLTFRAAANASGADYATFTFQVQDDGGTLNGGVDLDTTARTMTIDVTSVNDAPVGTSTTVTTGEDTAFVFNSAAFGFTDPNDTPANALSAVRISSLPVTGALRLSGAAVTAGQLVSAADIAAGRLAYTPAANANGAGYASFTFQVQDNGGVLNGGANLDPVARTMTIDVTPRNDAPAGANNTVTTLEDTAFVFATAAFGFTDPADAPGNALLAVRIGALPTAGALTLGGAAVSSGQYVSATDIAAGRLVYTPGANGNGAGYASFTFQVQDDGGTLGGGVDLDAVARLMTIAVTAVNDAPSGVSTTLTTNEDTPLVLSAASFGFADANDTPGNALSAVKIGSLPLAGALRLNGAAVSAGQVVSAANIAAGRLVFTAAANANGTGYASFSFQVQDDGGIANGGVDMDPVARTVTIDVAPVNDAPSGTSRTVVTAEDTPLVLAAADFGFSDPRDTPGNTLAAVKIASLATAGTLKLNGTAVTADQVVSVASINAGLLVYAPVANANGAAAASFTFRVQDSGGTARGGIDLDTVARTLTIDVTPVNDAPRGANRTVFTPSNTPFVFGSGSFGFSDPADTPANSMIAVRIDSLPAPGALTLSGAAVTAGQFVAVSDLVAGNLMYTPGFNGTGAAYSSFTFSVQDDGGGADMDPTPNTLTINVGVLNVAPTGTSNTLTTREDTPVVFDAAAFGFTDPQDTPANAFIAVKIGSVPSAGALTLAGVAVLAGQTVSIADIDAGSLVFTPGANATGAAHASFSFQVQDDGAGITLDPAARTMTIAVTAVNDAPSGTGSTLAAFEDTALVVSAAAFGFSDAADSPADNFSAVRIASVPTAGVLTLGGVAVAAGQVISVADLNAGRLVFTPGLDANGAAYASLTFQVQDDGGTADGGIDLDPVARTLTFNVAPLNDAPSGTSATVAMIEDTSYVFSPAVFGFSDAKDAVPNALLAVRITTLPTAGVLTLDGALIAAGQLISAADINAGRLAYTPGANGAGAGYASFTFQLRDDGGTADGGIDIDPVAKTLAFDVSGVNDAPRGTAATAVIAGDAPYALRASAFGYTDPDDSPANAFAGVTIVSTPLKGTLTLTGATVTAGQFIAVADLDSGALVYTPGTDAAGASYASFTFRVRDDGGGNDVDPVARALNIDIKAPESPLAHETIEATPVPVAERPAAPVTAPAAVTPAATPAPAPVASTVAAAKASADTPATAAADADLLGVGATSDIGSGAVIFQSGAVQRAGFEPPSREQRDPAAAFVPAGQALLGTLVQTTESALLLAGPQAQAAKSGAIPTADNRELTRALDEMRESIDAQGRLEATAAATSAAVGVSFSVGYVVWLLRGGVVLSTLLSSLPAWRVIDPLPVLGRMDDDEDDGDDDSLESLVAGNDGDADAGENHVQASSAAAAQTEAS